MDGSLRIDYCQLEQCLLHQSLFSSSVMVTYCLLRFFVNRMKAITKQSGKCQQSGFIDNYLLNNIMIKKACITSLPYFMINHFSQCYLIMVFQVLQWWCGALRYQSPIAEWESHPEHSRDLKSLPPSCGNVVMYE